MVSFRDKSNRFWGVSMGMPQQSFSIRIDPEIMGKMKTLAAENGRSLNRQIEFSLKHYLIAYEAENGEVPVTEP